MGRYFLRCFCFWFWSGAQLRRRTLASSPRFELGRPVSGATPRLAGGCLGQLGLARHLSYLGLTRTRLRTIPGRTPPGAARSRPGWRPQPFVKAVHFSGAVRGTRTPKGFSDPTRFPAEPRTNWRITACGAEQRIRTSGAVSGSAVFETAAIDQLCQPRMFVFRYLLRTDSEFRCKA